MASGAVKAARRFDAAVARLPLEARAEALAAIGAAGPALARMARALEPLFLDPDAASALGDLWTAVLFRAVRGSAALAKLRDELWAESPHIADLLRSVGQIVDVAVTKDAG